MWCINKSAKKNETFEKQDKNWKKSIQMQRLPLVFFFLKQRLPLVWKQIWIKDCENKGKSENV